MEFIDNPNGISAIEVYADKEIVYYENGMSKTMKKQYIQYTIFLFKKCSQLDKYIKLLYNKLRTFQEEENENNRLKIQTKQRDQKIK